MDFKPLYWVSFQFPSLIAPPKIAATFKPEVSFASPPSSFAASVDAGAAADSSVLLPQAVSAVIFS